MAIFILSLFSPLTSENLQDDFICKFLIFDLSFWWDFASIFL